MIEEGLSWPWQVMCVVGKLLGKKSGGDRVIGLIAMLCRVWSMAREVQMKEWSALQAETDHWDAAIAGNCALREAFVRALQDEVHSRLDIPHGQTVVDIASFYDSIEWEPLTLCAMRKGFPVVKLYLEPQICLAPRMLEQIDSFSEPFQ
eukprot:3097393-Pyramimonas_sp.AAC.1